MIPSVNFHLWEPCNMRCGFCFATFQDVKHSILPKGHLPREKAVEVVLHLADAGFEKITFAGGEPTLCPWLPELIATAKDQGLTTMIVTNGSHLNDKFLQDNRPKLDWIALSVDSLREQTNLKAGRAIAGRKALSEMEYKSVTERIHRHGYGLKINTVVNRFNQDENLHGFIRYAAPKRWKILQTLEIKGQNDGKIRNYQVSDEAFKAFVDRHHDLSDVTNLVPESTEQIKGSYAMVDPAGRFFENAEGEYHYSLPILEIGCRLALQQVSYSVSKFIDRGGIYQWEQA